MDRLELQVPAGEVFGFLGPNGAGKSTTVRLFLGLLRATSGRALIFGSDAADAVAAHRQLAYVPADVALWPNLTGAETLALLGNLGSVRTDRAYRAELVERVRPAGRPPLRNLLDRQPAEGLADRRVRHPGPPAGAGRADRGLDP